jgi:hypothetical protein
VFVALATECWSSQAVFFWKEPTRLPKGLGVRNKPSVQSCLELKAWRNGSVRYLCGQRDGGGGGGTKVMRCSRAKYLTFRLRREASCELCSEFLGCGRKKKGKDMKVEKVL